MVIDCPERRATPDISKLCGQTPHRPEAPFTIPKRRRSALIPDADARVRVRAIFEQSGLTFGSEEDMACSQGRG